jgi:hypothetical protein
VIHPADESDTNANLELPGIETVPIANDDFISYGINLECKLGIQEVVVEASYDKNIIASAQLTRVLDYFATIVQRLNSPMATSPQCLKWLQLANRTEADLGMECNCATAPREVCASVGGNASQGASK